MSEIVGIVTYSVAYAGGVYFAWKFLQALLEIDMADRIIRSRKVK